MSKLYSEDITLPQYPAGRVATASGASSSDLQNWANRRLIYFDNSSPGKGSLRLYTKLQVLAILIARNLMNYGVEAGVAFELAGRCLSSLIKDIDTQSHEHLREQHGEDGEQSAVFISKDERGRWDVAYADDGNFDLEHFLKQDFGAVAIILRYEPIRRALAALATDDPKAPARKKAVVKKAIAKKRAAPPKRAKR